MTSVGYAIGSQVPLPYTVRDGSGNLVDVASMTITVVQPDGTTATPLTVGAGITRQSTGTYLGLFTAAQAGRHTWSGVTTTPATALEPDAFNVTAAADAPVVGLADARSWLDISRPDYDPLIRRALARATEVAEEHLGETLRRTTVTGEVHDGGRRTVKLRRFPVITVTAVSELGTPLSATDGVDWTLDPNTGLLYRGSQSSRTTWQDGVRAVSVTYVAGYTVVPDRYLGAVEELTRQAFAAIQDGDGQPGGADAYDDQTTSLRKAATMLLGPRLGDL